jgi:hypothetical protein
MAEIAWSGLKLFWPKRTPVFTEVTSSPILSSEAVTEVVEGKPIFKKNGSSLENSPPG